MFTHPNPGRTHTMIRNTASFGSIEVLESRLLMASDTVTVRGTDSSDLMTVQVRLAKDGSKELQVTINGTRRRFNLTGINNISIESIGGNDQIFVNENTVRPIIINGGLGDDSIIGGAGNDRITGGRGFDTLVGNDGNDLLKGYDSSDTLIGGDGNDRLDGGAGMNLAACARGRERTEWWRSKT